MCVCVCVRALSLSLSVSVSLSLTHYSHTILSGHNFVSPYLLMRTLYITQYHLCT